MFRLFRFILTANRKLRGMAVGLTLRLLRLIRDIERDEAYRYSDKLDEFDLNLGNVSRRDYNVIEEGYSNCEGAIVSLDSAIEELEFVY